MHTPTLLLPPGSRESSPSTALEILLRSNGEIASREITGSLPFGPMVAMEDAARVPGADRKAIAFAEEMLRSYCPLSLPQDTPTFVSPQLIGGDDTHEEQTIKNICQRQSAAGLTTQADALRQQYDLLTRTRNTLRELHRLGLLTLDRMIPMDCLPEFILAAPVWYNTCGDNESSGWLRATATNTAAASIQTQLWSFYNVTRHSGYHEEWRGSYKHRTPIRAWRRSIAELPPGEPMPLALSELITPLRPFFDTYVIATPYHGEAAAERADASRHKAHSVYVDPYLVGFLWHLPVFFLVGRWSGAGIFPKVTDMIAATTKDIGRRINEFAEFSGAPLGLWRDAAALGQAEVLSLVRTGNPSHALYAKQEAAAELSGLRRSLQDANEKRHLRKIGVTVILILWIAFGLLGGYSYTKEGWNFWKGFFTALATPPLLILFFTGLNALFPDRNRPAK